MTLERNNMDYYNKMEELQDKLRRSEEERELLQRQFDLMVQANREKERARVAAVEARYKRFLDEDRRRRDRNSSLLQALERIDNHTANLAAKTERMRLLRRHYEAFIAHAYPGWHLPRCPLAPFALERISAGSDVYVPDAEDYSQTQYRDLPKITTSSKCPLSSPLCRSDLSIASRDDFSPFRRSLSRGRSAPPYRSASLSPSRVRELSPRYEKEIVPREYESFKKTHEPISSPRTYESKSYDSVVSPRYRDSQHLPSAKYDLHKINTNVSHYYPENERCNSDLDADQNTSKDLLNLSLSDDGLINEMELPLSPTPVERSSISYTSPRSFYRKSFPPAKPQDRPYTPSHDTYFSHKVNQEETCDPAPKSILSTRDSYLDTRSELPTSVPISESIHRILLSPQDTCFDSRPTDLSLSPRQSRPTWQTLRPSYLHSPRSTVRRSVTFTEPELSVPYSKYHIREDSPSYSIPYSSLRRHSPSSSQSSFQLTDHERYLRDKQGREKDAFQEKIQRLKELIQENKEQAMDRGDVYFDTRLKTPPSKIRSDLAPDDNLRELDTVPNKDQDRDGSRPLSADEKGSRRSSTAPDLTMLSRRPSASSRDPSPPIRPSSQSRRPSVASDQLSQSRRESIITDIDSQLANKRRTSETDREEADKISEKEQWSGQFNEKDEDALQYDKNKTKFSEDVSNELGDSSRPLSRLMNDHRQEDDVTNNVQEEYRSVEGQPDRTGGHLSKQSEDNQQQPAYQQLEDYDYKLTAPPEDITGLSEQNQDPNYSYQDPQEQQVSYDYQDPQSYTYSENQQDQSYNYQPEQTVEEQTDYSYAQDQQPQIEQNTSYNYQNQPQSKEQDVDYNYQQPLNGRPQESYAQQEMAYGNAEYAEQPNYDSYPEGISHETQPSRYDGYVQDQPQAPQESGQYVEQQGEIYETYPPEYQQKPEDSDQYQQQYQNYSQDAQYNQSQPNYTDSEAVDYQYQQDPNAPAYQYEGQKSDYNYQQDQSGYNYQDNQNYGQAQEQYQQDQTYQEVPYQDQQYQKQDPYDYGAAPEPVDVSEETTPSSDARYNTQQYQDPENTQQSLDQYRNILGVDSNSEALYSESSEIENQMAAVVAQGRAPGQQERRRSGEDEPSAPETPTPAQVNPQPATASPSPAPAKGKPSIKKRPLLTRKQSIVSSENSDTKQPATQTLPKTVESDLPGDSDFDVSSSH